MENTNEIVLENGNTPIADDKLVSLKEDNKRDYALDNFRGFVVFIVFLWCCMFLPLNEFSWLQHTDKFGYGALDSVTGFGIMDYGMMMFSLALGLLLNVNFLKKKERMQSSSKARLYYVKRGLMLMGVGGFDLIFKNIGDNTVTSPYGWEIFMTFGFATIICSFLLGRKQWIRIVAGVVLLAVYGIIAEFLPQAHDALYTSNKMPYGTCFGSIGLAGILLWFSVLGEWYKENKIKFLLGVLVIWIISIPSIVITFLGSTSELGNVIVGDMNGWQRTFSINFYGFSVGFLIFGTGFALLMFLPFWGISLLIKRELPFIATMGKNTLIFFFLFGIFTIPSAMIFDALGEDLEALAIFLNALMVVAVTFPLAYLFKRKNWILKV